MYKEKICKRCGDKFIPKTGNSIYCGSQIKKFGCSYLVQLNNKRNEDKKSVKKRWRKYHQKIITKRGYRNCLNCQKVLNTYNFKKRFCDDCLKIKIKEREDRKRILLGKRRLRLRFLILERDNFTCRYCGKKPPEVILEIDHKYPKSKGGIDKIENFITSCRDCNLGKGDYLLKEFS